MLNACYVRDLLRNVTYTSKDSPLYAESLEEAKAAVRQWASEQPQRKINGAKDPYFPRNERAAIEMLRAYTKPLGIRL